MRMWIKKSGYNQFYFDYVDNIITIFKFFQCRTIYMNIDLINLI